jgi:hypothetical protein
MDETFRKVEEHLRTIISPRKRGIPIGLETDLCRDLGIYGDDLAFDVILWAQREFGVVEGSLRFADYAPGERPFCSFWRLSGKLTAKKERTYMSLTMRDIVAAIEAKRWPD